MPTPEHYDVVIIGAGLAGLALARQLVLASGKKILLLDKRAEIPPRAQKVGEATVQVSGYYFSKVLDLEEHLLREHFMKYNLRFFYKTPGRDNSCYEDYSQSYIRPLSNIATYQLDRNKLEAELLRRNSASPNCTFYAPVTALSVLLSDAGPHALRFTANGCEVAVSAEWVVDTSGRRQFLARRMGLVQPNPIRHGASFFWVEGLVNIEKLTDLTPREIRLRQDRAALGHLPVWLATNHFVGEGFWFWVIPLQGKTSLGLVYDQTIFPRERVSTLEKLIAWVCQEFPLFARDLPSRKILHASSFKDFSYDCAQTIHASKWALSGEAGRFSDPLYSPGGDLIALYNTLITDAVLTTDASALATKVRLYEQLMHALYEAYVPSYALSYDVLGDQEAFALKYTWELSVYFAFYAFPFLNDLFTNRQFILLFLSKFSRLGQLNRNLQAFISAYYQWKKRKRATLADGPPASAPRFHDFTALQPLRTAESTFYRVGVTVEDARGVLDEQLANLKELAQYIVTYVSAVVLADERVLTNRAFIEGIDVQHLRFDPAEISAQYAQCAALPAPYTWSFDPWVLSHLQPEPQTVLTERVAAVE
jgi:2-polyprenyl-6-methoxyphenol hydroxylase-like FAD-dependent oxidoreductase